MIIMEEIVSMLQKKNMQSMDLRENLGVSLREDAMRSIRTCNETLSADIDLFYPYSLRPKVYQSDQ